MVDLFHIVVNSGSGGWKYEAAAGDWFSQNISYIMTQWITIELEHKM